MPTTVELPTLQELSVDEVSGGCRFKKAETKASMSASPLVSFAAQDALLQVSLTFLTSVSFSSQGGKSKPPSAARAHETFRCLMRVTTFLNDVHLLHCMLSLALSCDAERSR